VRDPRARGVHVFPQAKCALADLKSPLAPISTKTRSGRAGPTAHLSRTIIFPRTFSSLKSSSHLVNHRDTTKTQSKAKNPPDYFGIETELLLSPRARLRRPIPALDAWTCCLWST
ncbi:unnamed protein product, partial [Sphacelaria rigidula]